MAKLLSKQIRAKRRMNRHLWKVKKFNKNNIPIIYIKTTNQHIYVTIVDNKGNTLGQISTYKHQDAKNNSNRQKCYNIKQTQQFAVEVIDYFKQKGFVWSKKVLYTYGKKYIGKVKVLCDKIYQLNGESNEENNK